MKKQMTLPEPIASYVRAVNAGDADAFLSVFADDAVVLDVGRKMSGRDAIQKWSLHDIFGVAARLDPVKVRESDEGTVVTIKIDGTFDRTGLPDPLLMDHAFKVRGRQILELKVTFT
jgi:uncharacterized protein (TIGR02246 family)